MKKASVKCLGLALLAAGSLLAGEPAGQKLRQELSHSPDRCMEVFQDGKADPALRRTAFRFLLESPRAEEVLNSGMKDTDSVIRCRAIYELFQRQGVNSYEFLKAAAMSETNPQAAPILLGCAKNFPDKEKSRELLTELAQKSKVRDVRRSANRIVDFPFFREVRLLRNDPTHDHEVVTVMSVPLPHDTSDRRFSENRLALRRERRRAILGKTRLVYRLDAEALVGRRDRRGRAEHCLSDSVGR